MSAVDQLYGRFRLKQKGAFLWLEICLDSLSICFNQILSIMMISYKVMSVVTLKGQISFS